MDTLEIYTVYDHPSDYPDHYVCRRVVIEKAPPREGDLESCRNPSPDPSFFLQSKQLAEIQHHLLQKGLFRLSRDPDDDPVILET